MKYPEKLIIPYFFRVWKRLMEDVKLFLRHWDKIRPSSIFSRSGQSYLKHHTFFFFFFFFLNYPFSTSEKGLSHTIPLSLFFFFLNQTFKTVYEPWSRQNAWVGKQFHGTFMGRETGRGETSVLEILQYTSEQGIRKRKPVTKKRPVQFSTDLTAPFNFSSLPPAHRQLCLTYVLSYPRHFPSFGSYVYQTG